MPANPYHLTTHWRLEGSLKEIIQILGDAPGLVRWWPSVYLKAHDLAPGNSGGIGRRVEFLAKG